MDPILLQKKPTSKKRGRTDIITKHIKLYEELKSRHLEGVLLDAAVWICAEDEVVQILDYLCLGNLDGGSGTAHYVKTLVAPLGKSVDGEKAVRLSIDEAYFMAYALGCMTVHDIVNGAAVELGCDGLWRRFQQARSDFLTLYLAYHHFRSKGWIPRTGLQYGVDMVLYQRHPALSHSEFSVVIIPMVGAHGLCPTLERPSLCWHDVQVTNRLTTQVGKRLLLFYVQDNNPLGADYGSPKCMANFAVQERLVRRWVPESQRMLLPQKK